LGAAYLVFLGLSALWQSWRAAGEDQGPKLMGNPYVQALLTQMGNPKAILFFGALVPQFLDTHAPLLIQYVIMYAVTFIGEAVILTGYGALAAMGGRSAGLRHAVWRERVSGLVLLSLGVLAALYSA